MGGPNTNFKFFNEYSNKFAETKLFSIINIGNCNLHGGLLKNKTLYLYFFVYEFFFIFLYHLNLGGLRIRK